jgi:hypothetical protein
MDSFFLTLFLLLAQPSSASCGSACQVPESLGLAPFQVTRSEQFVPTGEKAVLAQNVIDDLLFAQQSELGVTRAPLCDDLTFLRRVTLDLTGRLPELDRIQEFMADDSPDKRAAYIDELLASDGFVDRFSYWWGELVGASNFTMIQSTARSFHNYLIQSMAANRPIDEMVRDMIHFRGNTLNHNAGGYLIRAGERMAWLQDRADSEALNIAKHFLGISAECISCHDGYGHLESVNLDLSRRTRADFWGLAAFMVQKSITADLAPETHGFDFNDRVENVYYAQTEGGQRPPRNGGGAVEAVYPFSGERPAEGEIGTAALARIVTADRQFARNFANRFWGHLMTLPLVDVDQFDLARLAPSDDIPAELGVQPLNVALLELLTDQLIASGFDLRAYLRLITNSASYQLVSGFRDVPASELGLYTQRYPRKLTGEEVFDSISIASGLLSLVWSQRISFSDDPFVPPELFNYYFAHQHYTLAYDDGIGLGAMLSAFGAGDRYVIPRTNQADLAQVLMLMNSDMLNQRISLDPPRWIVHSQVQGSSNLAAINQSPGSDLEKVRRSYLAVLVREPNSAELRQVNRAMGKRGFKSVASDLWWALFNHSEFLYND